MTEATQLPTVQFKKHKAAFTLAALVCLAGVGLFYMIFKDESLLTACIFCVGSLLLSVYCAWNAISNAVVLELNPDGIRYREYYYHWNRLSSYAIRREEDEGGSFNYLVLNLKNSKVPLEIQLDWIDDESSVKEHMAIFAEAYHIQFDGVLKKIG